MTDEKKRSLARLRKAIEDLRPGVPGDFARLADFAAALADFAERNLLPAPGLTPVPSFVDARLGKMGEFQMVKDRDAEWIAAIAPLAREVFDGSQIVRLADILALAESAK